MSNTDSAKLDRPKPKSVKGLSRLWRFARPYRFRIFVALIALTGAAGSTLAIGQAVRRMVDNGFGQAGEGQFLDEYFIALFGVFALLAL
ncbi:MAG: hypothetical protein MI810_01930, partial [Flavobacteriales bacterium]|nr:hypothetical protein [Flavobacteriales bacterium]